MNAILRGIKNTFRNTTRSVGIILILTVVIALSISTLIARESAGKEIATARNKVGNTLTVRPAFSNGFEGSGSLISAADLTTIKDTKNVTGVDASLTASLSSTETNLVSPAPTTGGFGGFGGFGGGGGSFTPHVTAVGADSPGTALVGGFGGGGTETITSGTSFGAGSTADVAVVGTDLATKNNLKVGSTFTAWSTTFHVIGIYSAGSSFADADALMPLATVQKLTDQAGEASNVSVTVATAGDVSAVQTALTSALGSSFSVINTTQAAETSLSSLSDVQSTSTYLLIGTVIGAGVILLFSMLMIVRERRREIGVLKALGAPNRSIISQFVAESVTFTLIGTVVGFVIGLLMASPIASALLSASSQPNSGGPGGFSRGSGFTPPAGSNFHFGGRGFSNALTQLHTSFGWSTLVLAVVIAVAVAVVGSSVAVAAITRIRPAEVLRSE